MEIHTLAQPEKDLPSLVQDGLEWTILVKQTLVRVIGESHVDGGITYDEAVARARRELDEMYPHLTHDWDFFDDILNRLSISRVVDSNSSNRMLLNESGVAEKAFRSIGYNSLRAYTESSNG